MKTMKGDFLHLSIKMKKVSLIYVIPGILDA